MNTEAKKFDNKLLKYFMKEFNLSGPQVAKFLGLNKTHVYNMTCGVYRFNAQNQAKLIDAVQKDLQNKLTKLNSLDLTNIPNQI
jgi:hypothetical protein